MIWAHVLVVSRKRPIGILGVFGLLDGADQSETWGSRYPMEVMVTRSIKDLASAGDRDNKRLAS